MSFASSDACDLLIISLRICLSCAFVRPLKRETSNGGGGGGGCVYVGTGADLSAELPRKSVSVSFLSAIPAIAPSKMMPAARPAAPATSSGQLHDGLSPSLGLSPRPLRW